MSWPSESALEYNLRFEPGAVFVEQESNGLLRLPDPPVFFAGVLQVSVDQLAVTAKDVEGETRDEEFFLSSNLGRSTFFGGVPISSCTPLKVSPSVTPGRIFARTISSVFGRRRSTNSSSDCSVIRPPGP